MFENPEGIVSDSKPIAEDVDEQTRSKKRKFDLMFHESTKTGKVGRPKESKVKFAKKSPKLKANQEPKKELSDESTKTDAVTDKEIVDGRGFNRIVVCCFPPPRYEVYDYDYVSLKPCSFLTNSVVDFTFCLTCKIKCFVYYQSL